MTFDYLTEPKTLEDAKRLINGLQADVEQLRAEVLRRPDCVILDTSEPVEIRSTRDYHQLQPAKVYRLKVITGEVTYEFLSAMFVLTPTAIVDAEVIRSHDQGIEPVIIARRIDTIQLPQ
jgi:hypothetical protein